MTHIINLKTEFMTTPIGIDMEHPRFSWQIQSNENNIIQQSYRIVCSYENDFSKPIFDSMVINSREQNNILYMGDKLKPHTKVYRKVDILLNNDPQTYSQSSFFETGFMDNRWEAKWIVPAKKVEPNQPCGILKTKVNIKSKIKSARLYISALGLYSAYINGAKVGSDYLTPGWTSYNN